MRVLRTLRDFASDWELRGNRVLLRQPEGSVATRRYRLRFKSWMHGNDLPGIYFSDRSP